MTPPRSSALSKARREQLDACRTIVRAEEAAERLIGMFTWSDVCRWSENDGDIAYDYARATAHLCRLALDAEALLRAEASPPAALPAETPRAETCDIATCECGRCHCGWRCPQHPDRNPISVCPACIGADEPAPERIDPQASRAVEGDEPEPTR
jgi:hypothetical protein